MLANAPSPEHALAFAVILFAIGLAGVLARRDFIYMLLSVEIMLSAAGVAFVAAGARWAQPDGQIMFIFILSMAAAEIAVGLALAIRLFHMFHTLDVDVLRQMRD